MSSPANFCFLSGRDWEGPPADEHGFPPRNCLVSAQKNAGRVV